MEAFELGKILENTEVSMSTILFNHIFYPEISVFLIGIIALMAGVFAKRNAVKCLSFFSSIALLIPLYFLYDLGNFKYIKHSVNLNDIFYVDSLTILFKIICIAATAFVLLLLGSSKTQKHEYQFELPSLLLFALLGMMVMISAHNLLVLYMGIELQSLCLYILAASKRDHLRSSESGLKYFVLSAVSSCLLLYGISLVYSFTGTINFGALSSLYNNDIIQIANVPVAVLIGLIFIMVALLFKISAAPFHMWTPDVYEGAPTIFTTFFAAAPKAAALCLIVRLFTIVFSKWHDYLNQIFIVVSVITMVVGTLGAIKQIKLKRLLAYSSISHIGFALLGIVASGTLGIQSVVLYLIIYVLMSLGAFACLILIEEENFFENINDLAGLSKTHPYLSAIIAIFMLSMAGIPPLAGFFAKLSVLEAVIKQGYITLSIIAVIVSVISSYFYLNIVKIMYFDNNKEALKITPNFVMSFVISFFAAINLIYPLMQNDFWKIVKFAVYEIQ